MGQLDACHGSLFLNKGSNASQLFNMIFPIDAQIAKDDFLFKADSFNQLETVSVNRTNQQGQVDIELLFNAAITHPNELSQIFNTQKQLV